MSPCFIERSKIYATTWHHTRGRWMLEAYHYTSQERLYTSDVLSESPHQGPRHLYQQQTVKLTYISPTEAACGEELLIQTSRPIGTYEELPRHDCRIDIIRGSNGLLVRRLENMHPDVISHPTTNQIAFVSTTIMPSNELQTQYPILQGKGVQVIWRYLYSSVTGLSDLYTDAVMIPDIQIGPNARYPYREYSRGYAVNPFYMTALIESWIDPSDSERFQIESCPLVPLNDIGTVTAMTAAVQQSNPQRRGLQIRQCYILDKGTPLNLTPRFRRSERLYPWFLTIWWRNFLDDGKINVG